MYIALLFSLSLLSLSLSLCLCCCSDRRSKFLAAGHVWLYSSCKVVSDYGSDLISNFWGPTFRFPYKFGGSLWFLRSRIPSKQIRPRP